MASNESKIPVGQTLVGKYRVVREIGRGGMAAVYEAEQLSLGKKVAVKVLAAELAASTIVIERFFREARAAASVKSPYIVDVYDSGRLDDGRPFIAMELLEGESLYDRMARVRIIDIETTIRVIVHTARGLVKAHSAGIVHRDLKPENIFLTKSEEAGEEICKILDFGLAKFYAPMNPEEKSQKRLTREGAVFGTPAYMSPEQVKGQGTVDHRADLWALGCMAFECLIGRPVWNMDQGVAMTFASIATGPIPVPSQIRGDLPPEFDAWFKKCLERDPAKRYQSARDLADAFVEAWGKEGIKTSSASYPHIGATGRHNRAPSPGLDAAEPHAPLNPFTQPLPPEALGPGSSVPTQRAPGANGIVDPLVAANRASAEVPPTSQPDTPLPRPKPSPVRLVLSGVFLAGSLSLALFVWFRFASPQVFTPLVQSTASPVPSTTPSNTAAQLPFDQPKFLTILAEGQKRFTQGDLKGAQEKFQEVAAGGPPGAAIAKVYIEQTKLLTLPKEQVGPCKPASFSRPRDRSGRKAERPAVLQTSKGTLVTWTEDREVPDKDHVWSVLLDPTGKPVSASRDLTPEASDAKSPKLVTQSGDRSVLLWWDQKGREAGVRARLLDADGRIDLSKGNAVLVGAGRTSDFTRVSEQWPAIVGAANSFFVVWQDDRDNPGKSPEYDLFFRKLTAELDTAGPETRLTDYHAKKGAPPRVRHPSVAVAANTMLVAYRLDGPKSGDVMRLKVSLDEAERGLPDSKDPSRESRVLGDALRVSDERLPGEAPSIACGKDGCYVAWHGEAPGTGVWVAGIDPNKGNVQWKKRVAEKGGHPSIAANGNQVAVAYYDAGRLKMAFLSRDGVTSQSTLFRVNDNNLPRPSLAPAAEGEWAIAWQDADVAKGAAEIYAARIVCK